MTNEYQNGGGFENHLLRKLPCKMAQSHDCIWKALWNHNLEHFRGRGEKKKNEFIMMNQNWFQKRSWFLAWNEGVEFERKWTNDDDDHLFLFYYVCLSICKEQRTFVLLQLFPCLCQFSTLMFPPCCAIGNHWKVSNDDSVVHPATFCLNFYLHLLQRNSAWNKSGTEQKTRRWFGSRLFFVVVTNFEALCFHRNRRVRRRSLSACGFFSSKMKTNLRLLLLLSLFPYWKGSHEFVRERNSLDLSFYCIAHRLFIRGCKHYKLLTNTSVFEKYPKSLC